MVVDLRALLVAVVVQVVLVLVQRVAQDILGHLQEILMLVAEAAEVQVFLVALELEVQEVVEMAVQVVQVQILAHQGQVEAEVVMDRVAVHRAAVAAELSS